MIVDEASDLLVPDLIVRALALVAEQAVAKIDRTRGIAGKVFFSLIHK